MTALPAIFLLLAVGVAGHPAGDLLAGREFLAMYMRQSRSQVPSYLLENDLVQQPRSAVTHRPELQPPAPLLSQEDFTTISENSGGLPTTTSDGDAQTTTSIPEDQSTEPPQTSQVVAVSVSSSVVRQKPGSVFSLSTQEEPTVSAAIQRSHFSVDEGSITIHKGEPSAVIGSRFSVDRSQDGEKTSLVVRQSNGEASSHFSIRQSHPPELAQQSIQHQRQLDQHQQLINEHRHRVEQHRQQLQQQHEQTVKQHQQVVLKQQEAETQGQQVLESLTESPTVPQTDALSSDTTTSQISPSLHSGHSRQVETAEGDVEDRREERTSFSIARNREEKSFRTVPKRIEVQEGGRQEERTSFSIGAQVDRTPSNWQYQERVFGEPEKNYEIDESVSVQSNGRVHGVQNPQPPGPAAGPPPTKSGFVVEGQNYRKYRVEEKTPDGFIVGEYGVVSHDDGSLRGVRYTADSNINPRLIYDALVKFLSLK